MAGTMSLFLLLSAWCAAALLLALLVGRGLARASRSPAATAPQPGCCIGAAETEQPFDRFDRALRALDEHDDVAAKVALLHWVGGFAPDAVAAHLAIDRTTVEHCLRVGRLRLGR
jgi:DNA-directed RNA polymerase specialized sigma24 family protein